MKNAYTKFKIRSLRGSLTRFLSIMGIVLLGVGFLSGLLATTPDMRLTTDTYYDRLRLFDLDVKSTLGLTDEDIEAISALPGVADTMPVYSTDIVMDTDTASYATRIYGYSLANDSSTLNNFELLEGRMPENVNECLIAAPNGYTTTHSLGEHFVISPDNKDYENISDTYAETEVTAVGIVRSPYYISVEAEPTTVGNGSISVIMYVFPEFYSLDVYTDMFLLVEGAAELRGGDEVLAFGRAHEPVALGMHDERAAGHAAGSAARMGTRPRHGAIRRWRTGPSRSPGRAGCPRRPRSCRR